MELDTVADIKLATRAFNEGWQVSPEIRQAIVAKAFVRATCGDPEVEDKAGKLLLAIDKFNHDCLESERKKIEAEHARKLQLIELAVKLGIVGDDGGRTGIAHIQSPESGHA